ncbi:MAG: hypothetical protein ACRCV3_03030 [Desulfovibrionaceae bacterium]
MRIYERAYYIKTVLLLCCVCCYLFSFTKVGYAVSKNENIQENTHERDFLENKEKVWYIGAHEDISDEERKRRKIEDPLQYWREKNYRKIPINTSTYMSFRYIYGGTRLSFSETNRGQHKGMQSNYSGGGAAFGFAFEAPSITTRMELEYLYRKVGAALTEEDIEDSPMLVPVSIDGSVKTILFNIYIDFSFIPYVVPYFSTGIGTSAVTLNLTTSRLTTYPKDRFTSIVPVFQSSIGAYAKVYSFIYVDIAVRYTSTGMVSSKEQWSYVYSMQDSMIEGFLSVRFVF